MKNVRLLIIAPSLVNNIDHGVNPEMTKHCLYLDGAYVICEGYHRLESEEENGSGLYVLNVSEFYIHNPEADNTTAAWWPAYQDYLAQASETFIQPKITGYRQLSQEEVALMNEGKALAAQCGEFVEKLRTHTKDAAILNNSGLVLDQRWVSMGASDLQVGFMKLIRGIAQPTTF